MALPIVLTEGIGELLKQILFLANQIIQIVAALINSTKSVSLRGIQASIYHKSEIVVQSKVNPL